MYNREYYLANKDKYAAYSKARKATQKYKDRAKIQRYNRAYSSPAHRLSRILINVKARAKDRGTDYDEDYMNTFVENPPVSCKCCQREFSYTTRPSARCSDESPSFDRIDSGKGYIAGNVFVLCFRCNSIKKDATVGELQRVIKYMEENLE